MYKQQAHSIRMRRESKEKKKHGIKMRRKRTKRRERSQVRSLMARAMTPPPMEPKVLLRNEVMVISERRGIWNAELVEVDDVEVRCWSVEENDKDNRDEMKTIKSIKMR